MLITCLLQKGVRGKLYYHFLQIIVLTSVIMSSFHHENILQIPVCLTQEQDSKMCKKSAIVLVFLFEYPNTRQVITKRLPFCQLGRGGCQTNQSTRLHVDFKVFNLRFPASGKLGAGHKKVLSCHHTLYI